MTAGVERLCFTDARTADATHRQYHRAGVDLRSDRMRLRAHLSGEPRLKSRPWRTDDARGLYSADRRFELRRPPLYRDSGRGRLERLRRYLGLRFLDAQNDRRDGAGG